MTYRLTPAEQARAAANRAANRESVPIYNDQAKELARIDLQRQIAAARAEAATAPLYRRWPDGV